MTTATPPTLKHIQTLCEQLKLGSPHYPPERVYGGFHHTMWQLQTDRDLYAVKWLSQDVDPTNPDTIDHYNVTEAIATAFGQKGIRTVAALHNDQGRLQVIDRAGYLVYPWSDAKAIDRTAVDTTHGLKVARLLSHMHSANLSIPGVKVTEFTTTNPETAEELIRKASEKRIPNAALMTDQLDWFRHIINQYNDAIKVLRQHQIISHGDLDQKNILWDRSGEPVIIDWENARKLNPTYELLIVALDWSGITSTFQPELFQSMLNEYIDAGGVIYEDSLTAASHRILGDWLIWLLYLLGCLLETSEADQDPLKLEQLEFVLPTLLRLKQHLPELLLTASHTNGNQTEIG